MFLIWNIRRISWRSDWIIQYQGNVTSWMRNLGICQDHPSLIIEFQTRYQYVYAWSWNHICMYSLWTYLITSSMFFIFRSLIIIHVANITYWYMVCRKPIPLMCMRSHHRTNFLYLSRMSLGSFFITVCSTLCILWWTVLPWKCGTLDP